MWEKVEKSWERERGESEISHVYGCEKFKGDVSIYRPKVCMKKENIHEKN